MVGMGPYVDGHVLSWILFMPGATALFLLAIGAVLRGFFGSVGLPGEVWRAIALGSTGLTLLLAFAGLFVAFEPETMGLQLVEYADWLPGYGVQYFVAVDGINLFPVLFVTLLVPLVLIVSWRRVERSLRTFVFFLLLLESAILGVFLSFNVLLFHLFWQLALVALYFIIGIWGGRDRIAVATKFLLHGGVGAMLMWVAILVLFRLNLEANGVPGLDLVSHPGSPAPGLLELAIPTSESGLEWWRSQTWLFLAFALAFAILLPLAPLHGWLPDALAEAPGEGAALIAGLLLQLGAYGLLRFAVPLFPEAAESLAPLIRVLALVSIAYAGLRALYGGDLNRVIAYLAMVQGGIIVLALFSFEGLGQVGSVVGIVSRGLVLAALILLVGMLEERRGTRWIDQFGGLARPMPLLALLLGVAVFAAVGAPGSSGFVFELLALAATFEVSARVGLAGCLGALAMALCLYRIYRRVMLGPLEIEANRNLPDLSGREAALILALLIPILGVGLYPNPVLRRIEPSVLEVRRQILERGVLSLEAEAPRDPAPSANSTRVTEGPGSPVLAASGEGQ